MPRPKRRTAKVGGGRANVKGYGWEREVAAYLTKVSGIEYARVGVSEASDREHYPGDIKHKQVNWAMPMSIECKATGFYLEYLYRPSALFLKYIKQARKDAVGESLWALAVRIPGFVVFVMASVNYRTFKDEILLGGGVSDGHCRFRLQLGGLKVPMLAIIYERRGKKNEA